ncbi:hypothetical protein TNCV_2155411 [Trichonephila clavipes]|nr:hypothetical protein TNCV_2155411 [Trichonephila clavipes]
MGLHYPAERKLQGCLKENERLRTVTLHGRTLKRDYPQFSRSKWDRPRYEIAPQTITPGVMPLCHSIPHSGRQRSPHSV